jgi:glyoxylase-like metal-dependent hydrolase (beta-lactamase superfamily II)
MKARPVAAGVWQVGLRGVNVFLIEVDDRLVLIDAGLRGSLPRITEAIYSLGRRPDDVTAIVVTHAHRDHVGGLAEMARRTGAEVCMHPADAALVRQGVYGRRFGRSPSKGGDIVRRAMNLLPEPKGEPVAVAHEVGDGDELPFDGLRAVHTPGHTAGHLALLLSRAGGVLFVGDAAANALHLGLQPLNEDAVGSGASLAKLARLDFDTALFSHGRPLRGGASARFREFVGRFAPLGDAPATG